MEDTTKRLIRWSAMLGLTLGWTMGGCASSEPPRSVIVVPSSATQAPDYQGDGSVPRQRYVVRMSDGERDWEVEFPETSTGYEMRIPLGEDDEEALVQKHEDLTAADKELLRDLRRNNPGMEREGVYRNGENVLDRREGGGGESGGGGGALEPGAELDEQGQRDPSADGDVAPLGSEEAEAAPSRPSYLLGIEEIRKLFKKGNYELAIIKVRDLEKSYPNDATLLSMKGTLWYKLGREGLARKAWERVLQIDPDNKMVIRALERLDGGGTKSGQSGGGTNRGTSGGGEDASSPPPPQP